MQRRSRASLGLGFALALCLAALLPADRARGETLSEALAKAYRNNPTLEAQRANLRSVDERVPQALSNWRPSVEVSSEVGYSYQDLHQRSLQNRDDSLFTRRYAAEIEQPLFRGGRTFAATRAAENTVLAQRAQLTSVEQDVLLAGISAYMDVVRDQAVVELNIRNEQRLARQLEATRDRFSVGEVTRTDVFQAEARLSRATADRVSAQGDLAASRAAYRNVIGEMPGALEKPPLPGNLPNALDGAIKQALENSPDIAVGEFSERAALDDVDEVTGELLPTVSLVGSATRDQEVSVEDTQVDRLEALVRLSVPLYQSGAVSSRVRQAKQIVSQQRRQLDQARRDAVENATQTWNNLETARAQIISFRTEVEANRVALEGVQTESEVGARTVLDVLDAEQELLNSQVSLVTAERDEIVAAYSVTAAIGDLTARQLGLPVQFYDPLDHYDNVRGRWFGLSSPGDNSGDFNRTR